MSSNLSSPPVRFVIVGSGKMAIDIAQIIEQSDGANLVALLGDSRKETSQSSLPIEAEKLSIPYLETKTLSNDRTVKFVKQAEPDFIISANNFLLFRQVMLDVPSISTINFHNGPLPEYAGVNPFCWAIINGDDRYGISWHEVETGIDSGPVLHIAEFELAPKAQAVSLMIKCIREGIQAFKDHVLPTLLRRETNATEQDKSKRGYYSKKDIPYQGILPWWESNDNLTRWGRALGFSPLPNAYYRPMLQIEGNAVIYVERIRFKASAKQQQPGVIKQLDNNGIIVATEGGEILLDGFYSEAGDSIDPLLYGFSVGVKLTSRT